MELSVAPLPRDGSYILRITCSKRNDSVMYVADSNKSTIVARLRQLQH